MKAPMRASVFTRARWAMTVAALLTVVAMTLYPGGTALDDSTRRYTFLQNFLSDLGMTVAYNGETNAIGASLFILGLCILLIGLAGCLVGFVRLYSEATGPRRMAAAAGVVGLVVCMAFVGVALTPENQAMALHVGFTRFAFRTLPAMSLLLSGASLLSDVFPRRVGVAWMMLTAALLAYVAVMEWGPSLATHEGLRISVAAQKIISVAIVGVAWFQCIQADRMLALRRRVDRN